MSDKLHNLGIVVNEYSFNIDDKIPQKQLKRIRNYKF